MNLTKTVENVCRTCMGRRKDNKSISIYSKAERFEDKTVMELLLLTTPQLKIEKSDMLPKIVCEDCLESLKNAYKFQKMCLRVEEKLWKILIERPILDHLSNNTLVNQAFNEPLRERNISLDGNNKAEDKDVKFETEEHQSNIDNSGQFVDDISREDTEWEEVHKTKVSKAKKLPNTLRRKVRNVSPNSPKNIKQKLENKTICHEINKNDKRKNFVCDECGSHLKTQGLLNRHKKKHIQPTESQNIRKTGRHECEFCKKVFRNSRVLKEHLTLHTGEQQYLCSYCGKVFNNSHNMQQHYLRHSTVKKYECPYCPKRFRCSSDLAAHKTVHNKKKPHICDICGSGFAIPYLLKKHKMYHTGERNHKCDFCDMRFFVADHCRRHMRTHTGEKPYKCKYCGRAFAQSNDMIKHLRVHLGDNVYKCDLCPQGYRLQRDLRKHFYTHKNDNEETRARNIQALKNEEEKLKRDIDLKIANEKTNS